MLGARLRIKIAHYVISVNQFGLGAPILARNVPSACLGTFGHLGDVRMHASALRFGLPANSCLNNSIFGYPNM